MIFFCWCLQPTWAKHRQHQANFLPPPGRLAGQLLSDNNDVLIRPRLLARAMRNPLAPAHRKAVTQAHYAVCVTSSNDLWSQSRHVGRPLHLVFAALVCVFSLTAVSPTMKNNAGNSSGVKYENDVNFWLLANLWFGTPFCSIKVYSIHWIRTRYLWAANRFSNIRGQIYPRTPCVSWLAWIRPLIACQLDVTKTIFRGDS